MSAQKLAASKRTMSALTNVVRERKIVVRNMPQPLNIEMRPVPKLENGESARSRAEFMTQSSQMLIAKRRYWDALIWLSQIQPIRLQDLIKLTNQINLLFYRSRPMARRDTGHVKKVDHHFSANTMGRHIDDAWVNGRWASAQGGQMASFKKIIFWFNGEAASWADLD